MPPKSKKPAPKKIWKATLASCPDVTVHAGAVYAYVQTKSGFHFASLEPATGTPRWLGPGVANLLPGATVADDARVLVRQEAPFGPKQILVLEAATGRLEHTLPCTTDASTGHQPAVVLGPYLLGGRAVIVSSRYDGGAAVVAFDLASGVAAFVRPLPSGTEPVGACSDGDRLFVSVRQGGAGSEGAWRASVLGLRGDDGAELWRAEGVVAHGAGHGVVVADERATRTSPQHTASGDDEPNELVALDAITGAARFRRPMRGGWTPIVVADRVICIDHHTDAAVALALATGTEQWSLATPHEPLPPGSRAPMRRGHTVRAGEIWLTGSRDRIVGLSVADGAFRSTSLKGFGLASDDERLYVADSSSLTACGFAG
jgi:hypothetical protein